MRDLGSQGSQISLIMEPLTNDKGVSLGYPTIGLRFDENGFTGVEGSLDFAVKK
jgi:hypothetical protein